MIRFYLVHKLYVWILFSISITPYFIFYNHNFEQLMLADTLQVFFILTSLFLLALTAIYILGKLFPNLINFFFISLIVGIGAALNFEFFYTDLIVDKVVPLLPILNAKLILVLAYPLAILVAMACFRFEIFKIFFCFFFSQDGAFQEFRLLLRL